MNSTQIIVLGVHRGGTSCVAGILHNLGIPMGYDLLEASSSNKKGHFEDKEFYQLNDKFIGDWQKPIADTRNFDKEAYIKAINRRNFEFEIWGMKDPRLCITIFNVYPLLSNPKVINVERSFRCSALSLAKREGMSIRKAEEIISKYDSYRLNFMKTFCDKEYLNIRYENIIDDKVESVEMIAEFVGVNPTLEALEFVEPKMTNFKPF